MCLLWSYKKPSTVSQTVLKLIKTKHSKLRFHYIFFSFFFHEIIQGPNYLAYAVIINVINILSHMSTHLFVLVQLRIIKKKH